MARKDEKSEEQASEEEQQLANRIKDSARQIWLCWFGRLYQGRGGHREVFERLVQEGEDLENRTRGAVNRQVRAVEDRVGEVRERATGTWDRLESVFDERVSKALDRLGIPKPGRVRELEQQVAKLQEEVEQLRSKLDDDK